MHGSLLLNYFMGGAHVSNENTLVSVIVPIYNVEKYLPQALESILGQTHKNLELICINDGSKDGSLSIIQRFAAKDSRVVVVDKKNEGYGVGCNLGISMARGQWVSIIEPDDWIEPTMYEDMLALASKFAEPIDIVKTPWTDIRDWNDPAKQRACHCLLEGRIKTSAKPFTVAENPILLELHPAIWSAIYSTDFLRRNNIRLPEYPGAGWADNPFLVDTMCQAKNIVYLDKPYYNYRCDLPGSTLNHATDEAVARPFDRWMDMLDIIERLGVTDKRIIAAHYVRGFNYTYGAIYDDGWDNPVVKAKTREVFSRMDPQIVKENCVMPPHRKKFFCEVMGLPYERVLPLSWIGRLASETLCTVKVEGPARVLQRARNVLVKNERDDA